MSIEKTRDRDRVNRKEIFKQNNFHLEIKKKKYKTLKYQLAPIQLHKWNIFKNYIS